MAAMAAMAAAVLPVALAANDQTAGPLSAFFGLDNGLGVGVNRICGHAEERGAPRAAVEVKRERRPRLSQLREHRLQIDASGLGLANRQRDLLTAAERLGQCECSALRRETDHVSDAIATRSK